MMATSENMVLVAISRDARIGRSTETTRGTWGACRTCGPSRRPNTTKIRTGTPTVPMTPSGSRTKILISSHVNPQSPRSMASGASVPNRVAGQLEKDVLECRQLRAKVDDPYAMLRQTLDHLCHQFAPQSADGQLQNVAVHRQDLRDRPKALRGGR